MDQKEDYRDSMCSSQLLFYYNEVMRFTKWGHEIAQNMPLYSTAEQGYTEDPDFEDSLSLDFTVVYRALWGIPFIDRYVSISRNIRILFHRLFR